MLKRYSEIKKLIVSMFVKDGKYLMPKILDIGCGHGTTCFPLCNVVLFDIKDSRDMAFVHGYEFVQGDAHNLPFEDKSFDVGVLAEMLEHVKDPVQVLKEAKRVCKNLVITVPNEFEWDERYKPFESKGRKSDAVFTDWHRRFFDRKLIEKTLSEAGIKKYKVDKLNYDGWAFWIIVCNGEEEAI